MNVPNSSPSTPADNARQLEDNVLQHAVKLAEAMHIWLSDTLDAKRKRILSNADVLHELVVFDRMFTKEIRSVNRAHQGLVKTLRLMEQLYPED